MGKTSGTLTQLSSGSSLNPASSAIRAYFESLESRIGYRLFLGGTRHFGFYPSESSWPWPIAPALRAMEDKLLSALALPADSKVLDAGCGIGHVALHLARHGGLRVQGIDLTPHHIIKASKAIRKAGLSDRVSAALGDYHDLKDVADGSLNGVYTVETLVYASHPQRVFEEFFRVLKPGGRIVIHEYDHVPFDQAPREMVEEARRINVRAAMVGWVYFETDHLKRLAEQAGFENVQLVDLSKHIVPLLWLFYVFAWVPHLLLRLLGLQYYFTNTTSGVGLYWGRKYWRYVQVSGQKPA